MKHIFCLTLSLVLIFPPQTVCAWSEGGHTIIAMMAFDLLEKEEQAKLIAILQQHPRFAEDFSPPKNLANEHEIMRWHFGRAGYWPDVARIQPKYSRPTWHYDPGPTLVIGNIKVPERPSPLPADANMETQSLNIFQAIMLCQQTLADKAKPEAERALAICWIAHLVADAHQPCHAGSLFMEKVFIEEDGDRGANRIPTKQRQNLHALWDQLLGDDYTLQGSRKRIVEITSDAELVAKAKQSISTTEGLVPLTWLSESRALAKEHVYQPEVIEPLNLVARGLAEKPEAIDLSEAYLKNAGRVAQIRAIEAAYRLAETWRNSMK